MKLFNILNIFFRKKEKIERPDPSAIVKISENAKEYGIYDDSNKHIDLLRNGKFMRIRYSKSDVHALREQGIPVLEEPYTDEYDFEDAVNFGGLEYKRWKIKKHQEQYIDAITVKIFTIIKVL